MTISVIKGSDNVNYNLRDDVHTWGGRNLIWNSGSFQSTNKWALNGATTIEIVTKDNYKCIHASGSSNCSIRGDGGTGQNNYCIQLETGTTYVYHAWLKCAGTGALSVSAPLHYWVYKTADRTGIGASNSAISSSSIVAYAADGTKYVSGATLPANTWLHIIFTFTTVAATTDYPYINFRPFLYGNYIQTANSECWLRDVKLEKGNKPTDWSPAPEDIAHVNGTCLELLS